MDDGQEVLDSTQTMYSYLLTSLRDDKATMRITTKEELFGKDKNIENNKMLKRKW